METSLIFFIIFGTISSLSDGVGVLPDGPKNTCIDEKVLLKPNLTLTEIPFASVDWSFGVDKLIINSVIAANQTAPEYEGRITLFRSTGSLELRNLTLNDSGEYIVDILPFGEHSKTGSTRLDVYEPVSVTVTPQTADLVEFNSTVSLSCSSTGSSPFHWMNGSSKVTVGDRVQINTTDRGSTLTIVNVTRYDEGLYECHPPCPDVSVLPKVNISVNYGPENIKVELFLSKESYMGSNITLKCSAESKPPAQFMWFLNGDWLPDSGPELKRINLQTNESGSYSCQAFNSKTLRYQMSQSLVVSVHENIPSSSGLSPGAIAGIVIACFVVVVAAAGGLYYCKRKR